jgi:hypothetical protein
LLTAVPYEKERALIHGLDGSRLRHVALPKNDSQNCKNPRVTQKIDSFEERTRRATKR